MTETKTKGDSKMADDAGAANKFWRETVYNDILELVDRVDHHPWSRRQTVADSHAVAYIVKTLRQVANDLYLARKSILATARQETEVVAGGQVGARPDWWPTCPYPEGVFPMLRERYAEIVPDPALRTALSGMLGREFWGIASETIWAAMEGATEDD